MSYKSLARVFARKSSISPRDKDAYYAGPDELTPEYHTVHVSVTFTWDIKKGLKLKEQWEAVCDRVRIGGPAFDDPGKRFIPGRFIKPGTIFTSRGCPNNCEFCFVPKREGKLRELKIVKGNAIADNNITACSSSHLDKVFQMLSKQRNVLFAGGLEAARVTDEFVERLRGLRIKYVCLAFDDIANEKPVRKAIEKLSKYFLQKQIGCFVLIGYKDDTMEKAASRLWKVAEMGAIPRAMYYRGLDGKSMRPEWARFRWEWCEPRVLFARIKERGLLLPGRHPRGPRKVIDPAPHPIQE